MKQISATAYQTTDGRQHNNRHDAASHELHLICARIMKETDLVDAATLTLVLFKNAKEIAPLLNDLK